MEVVSEVEVVTERSGWSELGKTNVVKTDNNKFEKVVTVLTIISLHTDRAKRLQRQNNTRMIRVIPPSVLHITLFSAAKCPTKADISLNIGIF
ncbi:MAG: hypothetical protein GTO08_09730 [Deltaproteobacteria bacterium]|nr:hypothetical protein [Deltaproteobacteria bacterium]